MEQEKVFPSAMFGFDKKTVLDYIYERDVEAKTREEGLKNEAASMLKRINELQDMVEELNSQYEIIKAQLYNEKDAADHQRTSYQKLKSDAEQLAQVARNKDNELQIQLELNKQLQNKTIEQDEKIKYLLSRFENEGSGEVKVLPIAGVEPILQPTEHMATEPMAEETLAETTEPMEPAQPAALLQFSQEGEEEEPEEAEEVENTVTSVNFKEPKRVLVRVRRARIFEEDEEVYPPEQGLEGVHGKLPETLEIFEEHFAPSPDEPKKELFSMNAAVEEPVTEEQDSPMPGGEPAISPQDHFFR